MAAYRPVSATSWRSLRRLKLRSDAVGNPFGVIPADAHAIELEGVADHHAGHVWIDSQPDSSADRRPFIAH